MQDTHSVSQRHSMCECVNNNNNITLQWGIQQAWYSCNQHPIDLYAHWHCFLLHSLPLLSLSVNLPLLIVLIILVIVIYELDLHY